MSRLSFPEPNTDSIMDEIDNLPALKNATKTDTTTTIYSIASIDQDIDALTDVTYDTSKQGGEQEAKTTADSDIITVECTVIFSYKDWTGNVSGTVCVICASLTCE